MSRTDTPENERPATKGDIDALRNTIGWEFAFVSLLIAALSVLVFLTA
jgi:hypothetical protein